MGVLNPFPPPKPNHKSSLSSSSCRAELWTDWLSCLPGGLLVMFCLPRLGGNFGLLHETPANDSDLHFPHLRPII